MKPAEFTAISRLCGKVKTSVFRLTHRARTPRPSPGLTRAVALFLLTTLVASALLYSTSSASSFDSSMLRRLIGVSSEPDRDVKNETTIAKRDADSTLPSRKLNFPLTEKLLSSKLAALPLLPPTPSITFFAADCLTPKTTFNLGEEVCVRVAGIDPGYNAYIDWVGATGLGAKRGSNITTEEEIFESFVIPTDGKVGTWRVNATSLSDGAARAGALFTVRDPANAAVDISVSNLTGDATVSAGNNATFQIIIVNNGPDPATNVVFTDPVPANSTFASLTPPTGFTCTTPNVGDTGQITCTSASLPVDSPATFIVSYRANDGLTNGTEISSTASVTSTTTDRHLPNNSSSDTVTVFLEPCSVSCPSNITVSNGQDQYGAIVDYPAPTSNGNCGTVTASQASNTFFPVGTTTVTFGGASGNSCSFTVTVNDTQAPVFTFCPGNITTTESSPGSGSATVNLPTPSASDNGPTVTVAGTRSDGQPLNAPFPASSPTTVTYTATDGAGNVSAAPCSFTVTVTGTAANCSISAPANISVNVDEGQCGANVTFPEQTFDPDCGTVTYSPASGSLFPVGTTTVNITASSGQTGSFTVTVIDTQTPVITSCPLNDVVATAASGSCQATVNVTPPTATDNCPTGLTVAGVRDDGEALNAPYPVGSTLITWTATDSSGNSTSCPQIVSVRDVVPPTVTLVPDVTLTVAADSCQVEVPEVIKVSSGVPDESVVPLGTASDNCVPLDRLTIIQSPAAGELRGPGTYTIIVTVYDGDPEDTVNPPNKTTKTMTLHVVDNIKPTIELAGATPMTVECHTSFADPGATATDNCGAPFAATPSGTVDVNTVGTYTITYNASDAAGNAATPVTRIVNVVDTTAPTIALTGDSPMTVECHTGFTDPGASATDSCAGDLTSSIVRSGSVDPNVVGTYTLTYNVSDPSGNPAATATRIVNVVDTTAPTLTLNGQTINLWPPNHQYHTINVTNFVVSASDGCDSTIDINDVVISQVTSDEAENGNGDGNTSNDIVIAANCKSVQLRSERSGSGNGRVYTITFRVKDAAGNVTTKTAKVTVPKSQGNGGAAVDSGPVYTVNGTCP